MERSRFSARCHGCHFHWEQHCSPVELHCSTCEVSARPREPMNSCWSLCLSSLADLSFSQSAISAFDMVSPAFSQRGLSTTRLRSAFQESDRQLRLPRSP